MSRLPFGISMIKSPGNKKPYVKPVNSEIKTEATIMYEQKLVEYRDTLENYKKCILEYSGKLDNYDNRSMDNQLSIVQSAIDLSYLKEQGDRNAELLEDLGTEEISKILVQLENMMATMVETNLKLEGMDKNVVSRLSDLVLELQKQIMFHNKQFQTETAISIEKLSKTAKNSKLLLWFLFVFNMISLGGIVFLILYLLEIIPF